MVMELKKIDYANPAHLDLLTRFLNNAGTALLSFRYFKKRSFDALKNHAYTIIMTGGDNPIGYGHLDVEDGVNWLGIAVAEKYQGKGYGKLILNDLILQAKKMGFININLSVDKDNHTAILLYTKYGFSIIEDLSENIYLMQLATD